MNYYAKLRLLNRSNGAFKANGIILRTDNGDTFVVFQSGNLQNFPGTPDEISGCTVTSFPEPVIRKVLGAAPQDSFVTDALQFTTRAAYNTFDIELAEGVTEVPLGGSINLNSIFVAEETARDVIRGIAIKPGYRRDYTYTGIGGYHGHSQRSRFNTALTQDKAWRFGIELECYARSRENYNKITSARSNWFMCERDGSLNESPDGVSGLGIEIKTIPLKACDAKNVDFWDEPMKRLAALARSKGCTSTGLHIHISKEIFGSTDDERLKNRQKLCYFYTYFVEDDTDAKAKNEIICGRAHGYQCNTERYKGALSNFAKKCGPSVLKAVLDSPGAADVLNEVATNVEGQRGDINLGNWNSYGTVEFRKGDGRISRTRLAALCTWWEQMCIYCNETHPRDFSFENFFDKVCREYPAVAYFFQQDDEQ